MLQIPLCDGWWKIFTPKLAKQCNSKQIEGAHPKQIINQFKSVTYTSTLHFPHGICSQQSSCWQVRYFSWFDGGIPQQSLYCCRQTIGDILINLLSCRKCQETPNMIPVSWTGTLVPKKALQPILTLVLITKTSILQRKAS